MMAIETTIRAALHQAADRRDTTEADWMAFEAKLAEQPPSVVRPNSARWSVPLAVASSVVVIAVAAVRLSDRSEEPQGTPGTSDLTGSPGVQSSSLVTEASVRALPSPAPADSTQYCAPDQQLQEVVTVPISAENSSAPAASAVVGYLVRQSAELGAQCIKVTEHGRVLSSTTHAAPSRVLQYAGTATGSAGTYQFFSATMIAERLRLTRSDGSVRDISQEQTTSASSGFLFAAFYIPRGMPAITSVTAYDGAGRTLNTLTLP